MKDSLFTFVSDSIDVIAEWPWAGIAAAASAIFAGVQILITRRDEALKMGSGLSCDYFEQTKILPKQFEPLEPGPWYDSDIVFRLENTSSHPYMSVVVTLELSERRQLLAFADRVAPSSTMYCLAGEADEHDFMFLERAQGVQMTFIDSKGKSWHRSSDGRLAPARHPFRRLVWNLWSTSAWIRNRLPNFLQVRATNSKGNLGATLHGIGDRYSPFMNSGDFKWGEFEPSKRTVEEDKASVHQREYAPTSEEWKLWKTGSH